MSGNSDSASGHILEITRNILSNIERLRAIMRGGTDVISDICASDATEAEKKATRSAIASAALYDAAVNVARNLRDTVAEMLEYGGPRGEGDAAMADVAPGLVEELLRAAEAHAHDAERVLITDPAEKN